MITLAINSMGIVLGILGCYMLTVSVNLTQELTTCINKNGIIFGDIQKSTARSIRFCEGFNTDLVCTSSGVKFCYYIDGTMNGDFILNQYIK